MATAGATRKAGIPPLKVVAKNVLPLDGEICQRIVLPDAVVVFPLESMFTPAPVAADVDKIVTLLLKVNITSLTAWPELRKALAGSKLARMTVIVPAVGFRI